MERLIPFAIAGVLVGLAACQPAPATAPGTSPVPSATAGIASSPVAASASPGATAASPTAMPSASVGVVVSSDRELVLGTLLDDEGSQLDSATVTVACDVDSSVNQTIQAPGSFAFRAPVGSTVTVTVSKDNYTSRTRILKVQALAAGQKNSDPNRLDFGGVGASAFYALSQYPEITSVTPANQATGVATNPLVVALKFSHPLSSDSRDRFTQLLQLHFQAPGGDVVVNSGFSYNDQRATLVWDSTGQNATFTFPAPIVSALGTAASVRVGFDTTVAEDNWPLGTNGKRLGRGFVNNATEGNGSKISDSEMAPIKRDVFNDVVPSTRPSPLTLWGETHWTDTAFSIVQDTSPLSVTSVGAYPGDTTNPDVIRVTFNKPVRGFPEAALDGSALKTSNYRFVLGETVDPDARYAYDNTDPAKGGQSAQAVVYGTSVYNYVELQLPAGTVSRFDHFKIYIDPSIKDINGVTLGTFTPSPTPSSSLSPNVLEGKIL